jgi:hypothetical protein
LSKLVDVVVAEMSADAFPSFTSPAKPVVTLSPRLTSPTLIAPPP